MPKSFQAGLDGGEINCNAFECELQESENNNDNNMKSLYQNGNQNFPFQSPNVSSSSKPSQVFKYSEEAAKFTPSVPVSKSPFWDYACTCIYAYMTVVTTILFFGSIGLIFTRYFYIPVAYYAWVIYDRKTCNRGGKRLPSVYHSVFYKRLANYFPIKFRYSDSFKLDPSQNYILNYHPHGISAFGCVAAFGTDGLNFSERFPGMSSYFMVHETAFMMPLLKEVFRTRGDCSVNSKSIDYMLTTSNKLSGTEGGKLLAIVVGGLAEADLSDSIILKAVIVKRKGFVKKALQHGANLIPCIGFGENSVFHKVNFEPNSIMSKFERNFYRLFGFKHPAYYGRCLFNQKLPGFVPYKRPITVVMGDPILVKKSDAPSQQEIDQLHDCYMKALVHLYESNSDLCQHYDHQLVLV